MKLKLFKKYFLTMVLIIVASLTVMMMILSMVLNNHIAKDKQQTLNKACDEIAGYMLSAKGEDAREHFLKTLITVTDITDADIFVADKNGKIWICGCDEYVENSSCMHSVVLLPQVKQNKDSEKLQLTSLGIYDKPHYVATEILYNPSKTAIGTVYAVAPISEVANLLSTITKIYIISAIVPIILMFFAIYAMTWRLTKPLKLMSEASRAMAKGDFSKRIPVTSDDEIGELAVSFNMMTNSLAQLEGMRRSFVANVSHELKTPMTTIAGFIDGILDGTIEPKKQQYYLDIVSQEVKRLSRLVQSMLSMSRLESGEFALKPELFDLPELLCTVVIAQEQRIEESGLDIIGLDSMQPLSVNADKDLIHQVLYNLVDNAVKFNCTGGHIEFSLKNENKRAILSVKNTGRGIPEKDLPFVFERFYKVDKSRSSVKNSTGLGLYIVKTIVNSHGGSITVSSKEDSLTEFTVSLPIG